MFEHILLETTGGSKWKKGLSIVVSTLTQCLLICAMVVSPLLFTEGVPRMAKVAGRWLEPPPPPPPPGHSTPAPGSHTHGGVSIFHPENVGTHPDLTRISNTISMTDPGPIDIGPAPTIGNGPVGGPIGVPNGVYSDRPVIVPPPPPPVQHEDGPVRITTIESAKIWWRPQPIYPPLAKQTHTQGVVRLEAIISRTGLIEDLKVVSGHPLLVPAALDAVRQWRYQATMLNGQAVEVITTIEVHFTLSQ